MITVITVCKDAIAGLKETLASVSAQESGEFEYIVVDGNSTDGTKEFLSAYMENCSKNITFSYVSEEDSGIYDAMNKGVRRAKGEYILFLNAGDTFYDSSVITTFEKAVNEQDADAYYGDTLMHYYEGYGLYRESEALKLNPTMPFIHQSVIVKRDLLLEHPFDMSYKVCADLEFFYWMRKKECRFVHCDFVVSCYDAREGLSENNPLKILKDNDRIFGRDKMPHYRMRNLYLKSRIIAVEAVKKIMPHNLLNKVHRKKRTYIQWIDK